MGQETVTTHDRILIATDNSAPARQAAVEALALAEAFDADLYAVYVLETVDEPPWFDNPNAEPGTETRAGRALNSVRSLAAKQGYDRDIETTAVNGETASAILDHAAEQDIDLIVLGTHGREGLDRLVVGSVAETVVRKSPVPVVTVGAE